MNLHRTYFTLFPQGVTVATRAHGPDMSKYDQFFLPAEITGQVDFVTQRVSYGVTRDEAFFTLVGGVMQIPIRGGYHYLSSWYPWREQADKYLSYIAPYDYHFHVCDFEGAFNTLSTGFAFSAWEYIHYIQRNTGKPCLLYTNLSNYNQYIHPSQSKFSINWNDVDLWLAQYLFIPNPDGTPSTPTGRTRPWKLWQYTEKADGTLYGLARPTACDLNVYNGSVEQMREWLKVITPPNGGTMEYGKVKTLTNIRNSPPGGTYVDIGDLLAGDEVTASEIRVVNGYDWWRLASWKRGGVAMALPAGECWAYGVNIEKLAPPAPKILSIEITPPAGATVTTKYSDGTQKVETI